MPPKVSVLIVNLNGRRYLKGCFDSLLGGTYKDIEIIFVDNGSSDGSAEFVRESYPNIITISNSTNLGLAKASNQAAKLASGKYLFFLNNDTIASPDLLEILVNQAESDGRIGILGCKTLSYDGRRELNCGVPCDIFGYPYGKGETFYVDAGIFIRRDVFDELGGFDEKFLIYKEDVDLCWRALIYGYDVKAVPEAIFRHDSACAPASYGRFATNTKKRFFGETHTLRMLLKNYALFGLITILPFYFLINVIDTLYFLSRGDVEMVFSGYFKAYLWNLTNFKDTLQQRREVQRKRRRTDKIVLNRMYKGSGNLLAYRQLGTPLIEERLWAVASEAEIVA